MWTYKLSMDSTCNYNVTFIEIHMGILTIYSKIDMKKKGWTKVETSSEEGNGQKGRYFFLRKTIPN